MPIYAYRCPGCSLSWERLVQRPVASTEDRERCPRCGEPAAREMSAPAGRVDGDNAANGYGLRRAHGSR